MLDRCSRKLHLGSLLDLYRQLKVEEPKQAVYRSLPFAIFGLVVAHSLPVAAAVTVVVLNFNGYYIGGELAGPVGLSQIKTSGLLFAAKLHELTMLSSLSVIVVTLIQQELVAGEGIPFGAIFGSLQFNQLSYLFSKEFFGVHRARFAQPLVKLRLIILLIVGSILALSVGPCTAIAMIPRVDDWPAGGTDFYLNASFNDIWPSSVDATAIPTSCNSITLDTTCISKDWKSTLDQLMVYWPRLTDRATMPESLQINSPESVRHMYTRQTTGLYPFLETIATTQMSSLADSLAEVGRLWNIAAAELSSVSPRQPRKFMYRQDVTYSLHDVHQPMAATMCFVHGNSPQLLETLKTAKTVEVPIARSRCQDEHLGAPYSIQPEQSELIAKYVEQTADFPALQFMELPRELFGNNTIGALIILPPSWPNGPNLLTCAVDAHWSPVTMQSTRNAMKIVTGTPTDWLNRTDCHKSQRTVNVTAEWAQYLNPNITDTGRTVFETLVEGAGMQELGRTSDTKYIKAIAETILTTMVTSGLSLTASSAKIQGQLKSCPNDECHEICGLWCLDIMPKLNHAFGYGGNIYNVSGLPDPSHLSKFTVQVDIKGYAYNKRGATMVLSCVMLIIYCSLASVHIVLVFKKRIVINAWDSVAEVTALAMQSRPTDALKNTTAGISSMAVFKNFVKVVEAHEGGHHLELDFGDHGGYGEPLKKDFYYG